MLRLCVPILLCLYYVDAVCLLSRHLQNQEWKYKMSYTEHSHHQSVRFKANSIEFESHDSGKLFILNCVEMLDIDKYLFTKTVNDKKLYQCVEIVERSKSILQLKMSEFRPNPDRELCYKTNLNLDPWLFISYGAINTEFIKCPFSGGFNMKVRDSNGNNHGCNYMALPMRFESECIAGEGIRFNFRKNDCTSFTSMDVLQKAICITHWHQERNIFIVMKAVDDESMWILRLPMRLNSYYGSEIIMNLFTDMIAYDGIGQNVGLTFYELILQKVVQRSICEDEYPGCASQPCSPYIKKQCPKTCRVCNPDVSLPVCSFPRRFRGQWFLQDQISNKDVNITDSTITINSIGNFKCVAFSDSPPRSTRMYTTETLFYNGCRPRYTCIKFKRLDQSVIGFALSQSIVWPFTEGNHGTVICDKSRFQSDVDPIGDTYHSYVDTVKPILPLTRPLIPTSCNLPSAFSFDTYVKNAGNCTGLLYQDCTNSSILRIDFDYCTSHKMHASFVCAATFHGRYWEKLIVLQKMDNRRQSACLAFTSLKPSEAILLPTSQCDTYAWQFADANIRHPLIKFSLTKDKEKCKDLPTTTTTTITTKSAYIPSKNQGLHREPQSDTQKQISTKSEKEYVHIKTTPKNIVLSSTRKIDIVRETDDEKGKNKLDRKGDLSRNSSNCLSVYKTNPLFILIIVVYLQNHFDKW